MTGVMLGSGRDKHRLETAKDKGSLKGVLQGTRMLGTSTVAPCNEQLLGVSRARVLQGSAHSEVAQRLREIQMTRDNRVDSS